MRTEAGSDITLGVVAGGRASRLGGLDKAWLERDGVPQVVRLIGAVVANVDATIVSANRSLSRYEASGLAVVADPPERRGQGPIAALDALARASTTTWLVTFPVDLVDVPSGSVAALCTGRGPDGAYAHDVDGAQPLVALWRTAALREALDAVGPGPIAVHALHARMQTSCVRFEGVRLGTPNTPADPVAP
jgi:molybdopterin-guanine dinucleotide biosynthesis protein A